MNSSFIKSMFVTVFALAAGVVLAQFVGPLSAPPAGNVSAPLNTGAMPQVKQSALGLTGLHVSATPSAPTAGILAQVDGPGTFGSLITANATVTQIANVQGATQPVCVNPTNGDLGLCSIFTVTLTANPSTVAPGATTTLTWNAPSATGCTATAGPGFTTGLAAVSGSDVSSPLNATTTFTISCTNAAGAVQTASTTVVVTAAPPAPFVVSITASPTSITAGQSSTLSWPNNPTATQCDASWILGTNNGVGPTSTVSPASSTTYTITCQNATGQTATDSVALTVTQPQVPTPTLNVTASGNPISQNAQGGANINGYGTFTINYTGTNLASCSVTTGTGFTPFLYSAANLVNGTLNGSAANTIYPADFPPSTQFGLTCLGTNGSTISDSVVVTKNFTSTVNVTVTSVSPGTAQNPDGQATISWTITNNTISNCWRSGDWSANVPSLVGSATVTYPYSNNTNGGYTYKLSCNDGNVLVSDIEHTCVDGGPPDPFMEVSSGACNAGLVNPGLSLTSSLSSAGMSDNYSLTYSGHDVSSCVASTVFTPAGQPSNWSGSKIVTQANTTEVVSTGLSLGLYTHTLNCNSPLGPIFDIAKVRVTH